MAHDSITTRIPIITTLFHKIKHIGHKSKTSTITPDTPQLAQQTYPLGKQDILPQVQQHSKVQQPVATPQKIQVLPQEMLQDSTETEAPAPQVAAAAYSKMQERYDASNPQYFYNIGGEYLAKAQDTTRTDGKRIEAFNTAERMFKISALLGSRSIPDKASVGKLVEIYNSKHLSDEEKIYQISSVLEDKSSSGKLVEIYESDLSSDKKISQISSLLPQDSSLSQLAEMYRSGLADGDKILVHPNADQNMLWNRVPAILKKLGDSGANSKVVVNRTTNVSVRLAHFVRLSGQMHQDKPYSKEYVEQHLLAAYEATVKPGGDIPNHFWFMHKTLTKQDLRSTATI